MIIDKPSPCSKRQFMYVNPDGADVTLYGGEMRLH